MFEFEGDLYGETMEAEFVSFIRKEKKFDAVEELKGQIEADVQFAKLVLRQ